MHLFLLCTFQLLLGVFYLGSVPRIYMDEAWDASLGHELAETGVLRHPFIYHLGGMEIYYLPPRVILPIICAGLFKIAGYSIAISRLPALLMGVLAVVILYHIVEQFFKNKQSFFICLAVIINPWFWSNCRRCRPEMLYTALALLFLWLMISYFRRDRLLIAFLAGTTAGLASLAHPNGFTMVVAVSIAWIMWKENPHLLRFVIWAIAGFMLIILPYIFYVFWATRQPGVSFIVQMHSNRLQFSVIQNEMVRWKSFFQLPFGIPIALVMFMSWLLAWCKSTAEDKFAATVVAVYILALPFFSVNRIPDYLVVTIPFFSILIVRLIFRLREFSYLHDSKKLYWAIKSAIILIYIISSLPPVMLLLYKQHDADFNRVVDEVAKVVGPKERVYADPIFWVGHDKYIYGPYFVETDVTMTLKDLLQWAYSQSFEYAVRTSWYIRPPQGFRKLPDKMPEFRSNVIADILCNKVGTKVYEFYDEYYGPVEIYKLDWSNAWKWRLKK